MGSKLKINLFRYKHLVFGDVIKMDESLRGKGDIVCIEIEGVKYRIKSNEFPDIGSNTLYVRGKYNHADNLIVKHQFKSEEEAKAFCKAMKQLVDKVNKIEDQQAACEVVKEI
jgi:hypothetical protein